MDKCEAIRIELSETLTQGQLQAPDKLKAHLGVCRECSLAWRQLRLTWRGLGTLRDEELSSSVAEALRSRILEDLAEEAAEAESVRTSGSALASVLLGVLFSVLSIWMLGQNASLSVLPPQVLVSLGAVWAAVYAGVVLLMILNKPAQGGISNRWIGLAGLSAAGISLVVNSTWSLAGLVDLCRTFPWIRDSVGHLSNPQFYFLAGGLYSLGPLFLAAVVLGAKTPRRPLLSGLAVGGVFMALTLPGLLLQCSAFSLATGLSWMFGAVAGALASGPIGCCTGASLSRYLPLRSWQMVRS